MSIQVFIINVCGMSHDHVYLTWHIYMFKCDFRRLGFRPYMDVAYITVLGKRVISSRYVSSMALNWQIGSINYITDSNYSIILYMRTCVSLYKFTSPKTFTNTDLREHS